MITSRTRNILGKFMSIFEMFVQVRFYSITMIAVRTFQMASFFMDSGNVSIYTNDLICFIITLGTAVTFLMIMFLLYMFPKERLCRCFVATFCTCKWLYLCVHTLDMAISFDCWVWLQIESIWTNIPKRPLTFYLYFLKPLCKPH